MGSDIDLDLEAPIVPITRAFVNIDSLTGSINIPEMSFSSEITGCFSFALDGKGIVFIDDTGIVESMVNEISKNKKHRSRVLNALSMIFLSR